MSKIKRKMQFLLMIDFKITYTEGFRRVVKNVPLVPMESDDVDQFADMSEDDFLIIAGELVGVSPDRVEDVEITTDPRLAINYN